MEENYQLHCNYLRENKDTGSGNGQKLVNLHRVLKSKSPPIVLQEKKESGNGPSLGCAVQEENDHPKGES